MTDRPLGPPTFAEVVADAWTRALAVWGVGIELSPPEAWRAHGPNDPDPIAYIDLGTRQVVVNFAHLHRIGALDAIPAVLAHEIGHHVRWPSTLAQAAELEVLQRLLLPRYGGRLVNLFYDLLINEFVGRRWADQLAAVYRGDAREAKPGSFGPLFTFYLAVYEELWGLPERDLLGKAGSKTLDQMLPGWRNRARVFAQTLYALPDVRTQFVYFCASLARILDLDPKESTVGAPMATDLPLPDADDVAGAIITVGGLADQLVEDAIARGWIDPAERPPANGDALRQLGALASGRPGSAVAAFRERVVGSVYARLVEQHLIRVPELETLTAPEPMLPSTTEDWDPGDPVQAIDWVASVRALGPLAAAMPLKRTWIPDDPESSGRGVPPFEVYVDTSGSMPDPATAINALSLAAQVLATAAIRRGGLVRAVIYASGPFLQSDWMRDEAEARRFLLRYAGGGTDFPFPHANQWADERPDAIRVVITDMDFAYNVDHDTNRLFERLVQRSAAFVALLAGRRESLGAGHRVALAERFENYRLVMVPNLGDLGATAARLADALFDVRPRQRPR